MLYIFQRTANFLVRTNALWDAMEVCQAYLCLTRELESWWAGNSEHRSTPERTLGGWSPMLPGRNRDVSVGLLRIWYHIRTPCWWTLRASWALRNGKSQQQERRAVHDVKPRNISDSTIIAGDGCSGACWTSPTVPGGGGWLSHRASNFSHLIKIFLFRRGKYLHGTLIASHFWTILRDLPSILLNLLAINPPILYFLSPWPFNHVTGYCLWDRIDPDLRPCLLLRKVHGCPSWSSAFWSDFLSWLSFRTTPSRAVMLCHLLPLRSSYHAEPSLNKTFSLPPSFKTIGVDWKRPAMEKVLLLWLWYL